MSLFDPALPDDPVICPCGWYGPIKRAVCDVDAQVCCPKCGEPVERLAPVTMDAGGTLVHAPAP